MENPPRWLERGYLLLFALLPWSVEVDFGAWSLSLPGEPLIAALGLALLWLLWQNFRHFRTVFSRKIFLWISLAYLVWMAASALFSAQPIVSWKYWLVEAGHWWVFATGVAIWPALWHKTLRVFILSLSGVAVYTLAHHAGYHFRADQALLAPMPFFPEHTMWAAAVAMAFFGSLAQVWPLRWKHVFWGVNILLLIALALSQSRAAWLSAVLAGAVFFWSIWGENRFFKTGFFLAMLAAGVFLGVIINRSSGQDVSAMERLNRWRCAERMATEKPVFGFGPGTFQFQYLGFQKPEEMTRISLRTPLTERSPHTFGRGGGAHSEYLRALSEMGWPGFLLWLMLVLWALWAGWASASNVAERLAGLALLTFFAHGLVNDFLHDGRMAALVWGAMAFLSERRDAGVANPDHGAKTNFKPGLDFLDCRSTFARLF